MQTVLKGHWQGDPAVACERLTVTARAQSDAKKLALLGRILSDPDQRQRLFELCERLEEEMSEAARLVGC